MASPTDLVRIVLQTLNISKWTGIFSPTRTKIDATRSILNIFSKFRILREAENTYYPFPARKRWNCGGILACASGIFFGPSLMNYPDEICWAGQVGQSKLTGIREVGRSVHIYLIQKQDLKEIDLGRSLRSL